MNTKALDALTTKEPDDYAKWARYIASVCQARTDKYKRPRPETAWQITAWTLVSNPDFRIFMEGRGPMGLSKFVATVIDIWGYWLNGQ